MIKPETKERFHQFSLIPMERLMLLISVVRPPSEEMLQMLGKYGFSQETMDTLRARAAAAQTKKE